MGLFWGRRVGWMRTDDRRVGTGPYLAGLASSMVPTKEQVEEYFTSITDYVSQIPGQLPNFSELGEKVLEDIRRFGPLPPLPSVGNIPGLGAFEVPALPPPPAPLPPPEVHWHDGKRPWFIAAAAVGTAGAGLWFASTWRHHHRRRRLHSERSPPRREVVGG